MEQQRVNGSFGRYLPRRVAFAHRTAFEFVPCLHNFKPSPCTGSVTLFRAAQICDILYYERRCPAASRIVVRRVARQLWKTLGPRPVPLTRGGQGQPQPRHFVGCRAVVRAHLIPISRDTGKLVSRGILNKLTHPTD